MHFLVSCPFGLSALLAKEIKKLCATTESFSFTQTLDTAVTLEGDLEVLYRLNLWSRIANKVYVLLGEGEITTFDQLFDLVVALPRNDYLPSSAQLSLQVTTKNSQLSSERTIQSVAHKAILTSLASHTSHPKKDQPKTEFTIFLHLQNNHLNVYLNTSGASLHQRGWRKQT
jgi:putative N6-adenine-specific DNA methylase